jgi:hypothetical protein
MTYLNITLTKKFDFFALRGFKMVNIQRQAETERL